MRDSLLQKTVSTLVSHHQSSTRTTRSGKAALIIGATSAIACAITREFAQQQYRIHLAGRDSVELERLAKDLTLHYGVTTTWSIFDALNFESHEGLLTATLSHLQNIDVVLIALGYLGNQQQAIENFEHADKIISVNFTSIVSILTNIAEFLRSQQHGTIICLSSVAGDRGRQSNYVYGAAKAGLSTYLQGLRNRLFHHGVRVITVKPGLVDTKMTYGKFDSMLKASPSQVAKDVIKALNVRQDDIYSPWYWYWIMLVIRLLPEMLFKRLKL